MLRLWLRLSLRLIEVLDEVEDKFEVEINTERIVIKHQIIETVLQKP